MLVRDGLLFDREQYLAARRPGPGVLEDRSALVVAGLEAREVVPGARAGARRGPEAHAPGDEVGPRGARARPVARR